MQNVQDLVKKTSRMLAGRGGGKEKDVHSRLVVHLIDEDHAEAIVGESANRKTVEPAEKGKGVSSKAFLSNLKMVTYFSCLMCGPTLIGMVLI